MMEEIILQNPGVVSSPKDGFGKTAVAKLGCRLKIYNIQIKKQQKEDGSGEALANSHRCIIQNSVKWPYVHNRRLLLGAQGLLQLHRWT
ncbi:hypothetical protein AV530_003209 [Patagioenas fasciata monilis]|uniref:Uncharacterized protein n=1 Tax=Patagioenas fasciata monilis TaxID=372326 RepID=A0A1V4KWK3_PATFA|nr:hypothetical protein AV530_003209 [Patagioenas fasciata monilis]